MLTVTVPNDTLAQALRSHIAAHGGQSLNILSWNLMGPPGADVVADANLVVVGHYWEGRQDYTFLSQLKQLKAVQIPSAGFEHALPYIPAGVALANGRGVHSAETAELAVGLILAMQRGIAAARDDQHRHYWLPTSKTHSYESLADRRVLIVGAGSVAKALAARLAPFEVSLTFVARSARPDPDLAALAADPLLARFETLTDPEAPASRVDANIHAITELTSLLPQADIVVLTVPADASTEHLIGAPELAAMRDGALLVNVARGPVVDTDALFAALRSGRIRAALDVTEPEPLPADHPLWDAPNVLITPHVGGNTRAGYSRYNQLVTRQVVHLLSGEPLENLVREPAVVSTGSTTQSSAVASTGSTTQSPAVVSTGSTTQSSAVASTVSTTQSPAVASTGSTSSTTEAAGTASA